MKYTQALIVLLCSFFISCSKSKEETPRNEKVFTANKVAKQCAQVLSERYGMAHCGQGGAMMYEIEDLFLAFQIYRPLSKDEARAILIDCAHEVISTVNQNAEIQKYLLPGGFNHKSVQIQIYISPNHKESYYPDLCVCSYNFGKLAFSTQEPEKLYVYKTDEEETYDEALSHLNLLSLNLSKKVNSQ